MIRSIYKAKEMDERLLKYIQGEVSPQETEQVVRWIDACEENRRQYMALRRLYEISLWNNDAIQVKRRINPRRFGLSILKYAAILTIAFAGALFYLCTQKEEAKMQTLYVPSGQRAELILADGTKVWLNSATKLKYPVRFDKDYREVFLEGEAYFDVNKDKRPFIVNFTSGRIQVLGTEFGIRSYEDDSCHYATLVEGLVHIYTKEGDSLEILPGEQAMISPNEFTKRKVQVDEYVGWKDGFFVFRQRSLGEIATQLEKWYDVQILFANDDLPKLLFTGYLKRYDDIDVFFDALKRTGLINYHIEGNHILVTPN